MTMVIPVDSIFRRLKQLTPRRIAYISTKFDNWTEFEDGQEVLQYKLRNREASFVLQLTKMGIPHEVFDANAYDPSSVVNGTFDLCIIGGDLCYQCISVGGQLRKAGFDGVMLFEM